MTSKLSHLDQFKMKHEEILQLMRDISRLEVAAIVGAGAVYSWLFVNQSVAPSAAWFVAPIVIVLGGLKCAEISTRIRIIAEYLRRIEVDAFGVDEGQMLPGYERYNYMRRGYDRFVLGAWAAVWLFVLGFSVWASCHYPV